jgi:hypothetical protein
MSATNEATVPSNAAPATATADAVPVDQAMGDAGKKGKPKTKVQKVKASRKGEPAEPTAKQAKAEERALLKKLEEEGDQTHLSKTERTELEGLEANISKAQQAFQAAGHALMYIREAKLWRQDYKSFDDYLAKRWDFDKTYASRLITAANVVNRVKALPVDHRLPVITTEWVAREVAKLDDDEIVPVLKAAARKAQSKGKELSAADIKAARQEHKGKSSGKGEGEGEGEKDAASEAAVPTDEVGFAVPKHLEETFESRDLFDDARDSLNTANRIFRELTSGLVAPGGKEPMPGGEVAAGNVAEWNKALDVLKSVLKFSRPHAVSPYAKGSPEDKQASGGRGWLTVDKWEQVPNTIKEKLAK